MNENNELSSAIEKTGQAVDTTYVSTTKLVGPPFEHLPPSISQCGLDQLQEVEHSWAEPLHEYSQFASIIKKLLAYRHQKHVQYEMTQDVLENKREQLEDLEKSEREARRLEEALGRGRMSGAGTTTSANPEAGDNDGPASPGGGASPTDPSVVPPHPGQNPARRRTRAPGMGLINALSYTLHGMMDVDPETARRNSITKTKESISTVSRSLAILAFDSHRDNV